MEISATLNGNAVTIVDIAPDGNKVWVTYKMALTSAADETLITEKVFVGNSTSAAIATSATGT